MGARLVLPPHHPNLIAADLHGCHPLPVYYIVWSFGVLCYEVASLGAVPYGALSTQEMVPYLLEGGRLPQPRPYCPDALYALMRECWALVPTERPRFTTIHSRLVQIMAAAAGDCTLIPFGDDTSTGTIIPLGDQNDAVGAVLPATTTTPMNLNNATGLATATDAIGAGSTSPHPAFTAARVSLTADGKSLRILSVKRKNPLWANDRAHLDGRDNSLFGSVDQPTSEDTSSDEDVETYL